ncbi:MULTISPECIES: hypothetical protein [Sphingobacterium]|uniref:hypothetical protein n=1 Tax=Sphingobacterium TaxID=28453 RepID=UPI000F91CEFB|nr:MULTISPECIES: hypothetical protein [Sphingobacterium]MBB2950573.1 hypothetical protein [Sphingobacterium sp. JUb56]MCW2259100.1 hypothetical protein [Sphingobacterium kitahiroshimense]NJI72804.1 hypothetical protein [Sphingobacterium sp. B16(2022)]QQD12775.1 hypothetical protein JAZ75_19555 [Sphingobacterium sp. UDSM-2020]TCR14449.1 hypothetical protein EDF67_101553 [Sphingobacterium sp. JUb78]
MKNFKLAALSGIIVLGIMGSCQNDSKSNNSEGNSSTIAPSAGDETRYNLSEQQEMTLQGDTIKIDSTKSDSIK